MPKYEVRLSCGKEHVVEADMITTDTTSVRFDNRAQPAGEGKPYKASEMVAYFPAKDVSSIIRKEGKK